MKELTSRQQAILDYIGTFTERTGYPPTLREIGENFEISSTNGVNDHLIALETKGFIKRGKDKSRAIEILKSNDNIEKFPEENKIPLVGRIAAGSPLLAAENIDDYIDISPRFFAGSGQVFSVMVKGDSMTGDGITEGDYVILRQENNFNNSDIFAVLVDDDVTLKRISKSADRIDLVSSNPDHKKISINKTDGKNMQVLGKMVGLVRLK